MNNDANKPDNQQPSGGNYTHQNWNQNPTYRPGSVNGGNSGQSPEQDPQDLQNSQGQQDPQYMQGQQDPQNSQGQQDPQYTQGQQDPQNSQGQQGQQYSQNIQFTRYNQSPQGQQSPQWHQTQQQQQQPRKKRKGSRVLPVLVSVFLTFVITFGSTWALASQGILPGTGGTGNTSLTGDQSEVGDFGLSIHTDDPQAQASAAKLADIVKLLQDNYYNLNSRRFSAYTNCSL